MKVAHRQEDISGPDLPPPAVKGNSNAGPHKNACIWRVPYWKYLDINDFPKYNTVVCRLILVIVYRSLMLFLLLLKGWGKYHYRVLFERLIALQKALAANDNTTFSDTYRRVLENGRPSRTNAAAECWRLLGSVNGPPADICHPTAVRLLNWDRYFDSALPQVQDVLERLRSMTNEDREAELKLFASAHSITAMWNQKSHGPVATAKSLSKASASDACARHVAFNAYHLCGASPATPPPTVIVLPLYVPGIIFLLFFSHFNYRN